MQSTTCLHAPHASYCTAISCVPLSLQHMLTPLCQAREWRQAMLCAYQTGQSQLVDSAIQPAAEDAASSAQAEAEADIGRIHKYLARLKEVLL